MVSKKTNINFIKEELSKQNVRVIESNCIIPDNTIVININNLNDYIDILSEFKASNVFYTSRLYDKEEYTIDKDLVLEDYGEEIFNIIKNDVDEYNKKTESFNFDIPYRINLYFIKDGIAYLYYIENDYIGDTEIFEAETELSCLVENAEDTLNELDPKTLESIEDIEEELKERILNDDEFKLCSNQSLRGSYTRRFINNREFSRYKPYFQYDNGRYNDMDVYNYIEILWKKMNLK